MEISFSPEFLEMLGIEQKEYTMNELLELAEKRAAGLSKAASNFKELFEHEGFLIGGTGYNCAAQYAQVIKNAAEEYAKMWTIICRLTDDFSPTNPDDTP